MAVTRAPGVVYTPREVCEPMVRRALEPLVRGKTRDQILALRICDPAIGEGVFLVEIVRYLGDLVGDRRAAAHCIRGVDIDRRAVAEARAAVERFVGEPLPVLRETLRVGDALRVAWEPVDALVANPPYVRQELLGARKKLLRSFAAYDGVADLYVYFVELAHRIVRPGGRYCVVVPNKWLTAAYGRPLRALLDRERSVEGLVDFGRGLFGDADAFPCIVWGTIGGAGASIQVGRAGTQAVARALDDTRAVPRARWRWSIDSSRDVALLDRLRTLPTLADVVPEKPSRGVITGLNRAFVIDAATRERLVERGCADWIRPFAKGRDIRRWRRADADRFIVLVDHGTKPPRAILDHLRAYRDALEPGTGRKPGRYQWYELQDPVVPLAKSRAPRLLYQDIQTDAQCCLDETGDVVPDTTVWILPSRDLFLLALLNSPLYAWYARRRFPPALNGAVRPKLEYMRVLPVARPEKALRARIEVAVTEQLAGADRNAMLAELVADAYGLTAAERALTASTAPASRPSERSRRAASRQSP
ncbi:MAG: N-6 DNA methylase [Deltaproteobacteria bacterium]|nr:N-6 DNA methylase [Deltaproteobacteria bacterium]